MTITNSFRRYAALVVFSIVLLLPTVIFAAIPQVAAGGNHTVGLKSDGTVVAVGNNSSGQCDVSGWSGIVQVAAGSNHTVGLKSDGRVVAIGSNGNCQCWTHGWTDIVQVAAGGSHTVGLRSDGRVMIIGGYGDDKCDIRYYWRGIIQVAAGWGHTIGLKSNGTVVAVNEGSDDYGQCDVSSWTDIVQVATGMTHTVGLRSDGTVVAVGSNAIGQYDDVSSWTDIVQVSAGGYHTVGLRSNGTVVAVGSNSYGECDVSSWTDIVQVASGNGNTIGLKSDGTVVAVGNNSSGQCDVGLWSLKGTTYISGNVISFFTGMPLAYVNITAGLSTTISDVDGLYIQDLSPGTYDVVYSKPGYQSVTLKAISIGNDEEVIINMGLAIPGDYLNIVSTGLPPAQIGVYNDTHVNISGGIYPFSYFIVYGTLPSGLVLDPDFGTITGTPTSAGSYTFAVAVQDSEGSYAEREFTIEVTEELAIVTNNLARGTLGEPYFCSIETGGGQEPYFYDIVSGNLPSGVGITTSGIIGGTKFIEKFDPDTLSDDWAFGGTVSPFITGDKRLQFGDIGGNENSYAEITLETNNQSSIKFDWWVSSCGADYLRFFVDGSEKVKWNYVHNGTYVYSGIPSGIHTFRWEYNKDEFVSCNADTGWIDNIYIDDSPAVPTEVGDFPVTIQVTDAAGRIAEKTLNIAVDNPLTITTSRLNDGVFGQYYNQILTASGGYGSYHWSLYNGTLPSGLLLDETTGIISGTPIEATNRSIVLAVSDDAGRVTYQYFTLHISPELVVQTSVLPTALINTPFSEAIRTTGGIDPYNFTYEGQLPAGLSLNSTTGIISGTPTQAGYTNVGITVTDSSWPTPQEATQVLGIRVSSMLTIVTSAVLPNSRIGVAMNPVILSAGGGPSPFSWAVVGGALPAGVTLDAATGTLSGTPLEAGDFAFTVQVTDDNGATSMKEFFWHVSATLLIDTTVIPNGAQNEFYSTTLAAHGGLKPYFWRIVSGTLPDGLSFNNETGTISGKPTTRQAYSFTVEVSDNDSPAQTHTRTYEIEIFDNLYIRTPILPNGCEDEAYTATVEARQGVPPYIWQVSAGSLPPGINLSSSDTTASLDGTPTSPGIYNFTLEVRDSGEPQNRATKEYSMEIYGDIVIITDDLRNALRGQSYSDTISVSGGIPPYHWQLLSGSLPTGLSLNVATGAVTGTTFLDEGTSSSFTIRVYDSGEPSQYVDREFTIQVISPLVIDSTIPEAQYDELYEYILTGSGGISPLSWSLVSGSLPDGITFDPDTGTLAGTPATCGDYSFVVRLTDSSPVPESVEAMLQLTVDCSNLPVIENFEEDTISGIHWYSYGDAFWTFSNSNPHNGLRDGESPPLEDNQSSTLETTVLCDAGTMSFWYAVDSEGSWDFLKFYVDGQLVDSWSGTIPYSFFQTNIEAGRHIFSWEYIKDSSVSLGSDMAWIDDLYIPLRKLLPVDFNGDGTSDILWRNDATGVNYLWYFDGLSYLGGASVSAIGDTDWNIVGIADFNQDSHPDILWRNTSTGANYVWYMDDNSKIGGHFINKMPDTDWHIVGVSDFNGDSHPDILWRNMSTGANYLWYLDDCTRTGTHYVASLSDTDWHIVGTADFNSDSHPDILWRNYATGKNYIYYMNDWQKTGSHYVSRVSDVNWAVGQLSDFNSDGQVDILWRNQSTGDNYVWYLNDWQKTGGASFKKLSDLNWYMAEER